MMIIGLQGRPESPNVGDLIEFSRVIYSHWAVYVGDGYVIHLTKNKNKPNKGEVKRDRLLYVAGCFRYKVNNILDYKYERKEIELILQDANSALGKNVTYNLVTHNCEHFATNLRYGKPESLQVKKVLYSALAIGSVTLLLIYLKIFIF
ncbi:phospholipase A and acyltransferase 4-like [Astyanax mexicanus]|uniref:phospholipase A and acyltransferase 4-like n=1 Tax=Astyanax mexicanus TaxID=7994 RepID=UPI0020CB123D|nr:phospholipase A and acyltransferase 4-like [Astyanax mexicanus]